MRKVIALVALLLGGPLGPDLVYGQSYEPFSQWQLDASLPLQYGTNALLTPTGAQTDFFISPYLKLSALGALDATTTYSIYALGGPDVFARIRTADDGLATVGGTVQKKFGSYAVGAIYEHSLVYDGVFRDLLFQVNDFSGYVGYGYKSDAGFSFKPSVMTTYRQADLASAERVLFTFKAALQQDLTKALSIFVTPKFRYYAFTANTGTSAGRRDTRPSILGGMTYQVNSDLGITGSVEYDNRWSNAAGKNYSNTVVLLSADFSHTYDRLGLK